MQNKYYKIKHENVVKILDYLDQLPYKYVKELIPFLEATLEEVSSDVKIEEEKQEK